MGELRSKILEIFGVKAVGRYGLSDVTQLQHALQCATLAETQGAGAPLVVAALLHDVGHMIHDLGEEPARDRIDDTHEARAAEWLGDGFGPGVTEPIRLHVAAKRYLCAARPTYMATLADDSVRSLALQGGPMSESEAARFREQPYFRDAVRLRMLDDRAKDPLARTPPFEHFLPYLDAMLAARQRLA